MTTQSTHPPGTEEVTTIIVAVEVAAVTGSRVTITSTRPRPPVIRSTRTVAAVAAAAAPPLATRILHTAAVGTAVTVVGRVKIAAVPARSTMTTRAGRRKDDIMSLIEINPIIRNPILNEIKM